MHHAKPDNNDDLISEEEKTEETSLMSSEKAEPLDFKMELPTSTPGI